MFTKRESLKVKGFASLLILFHHMFYSPYRIEAGDMKFMLFSQERVQVIAIAARIGVWIFAFVSAYGLTCQYMQKKDESNLHFVVRRWISLMKQYWFVYLAVLLASCLIRNPAEIYGYDIFKGVIKGGLDFVAWADFFKTPTLLGAWWYMCFAQMLVLLIPAVNHICKRLGWISLPILFLVMQYLSDGITSPYGGKYSNYVPVVFLGVLCARSGLLDQLLSCRKSWQHSLMEALGGIAAVIVLLAFTYKFKNRDAWQLNSLLSAGAAALICYLGAKYVKSRGLSRALVFLGVHSGNIYLIHTFFYTYVPRSVFWSGNALVSWCSLLALSLLSSVIFEFIKKRIHYNELFEKIEGALQGLGKHF